MQLLLAALATLVLTAPIGPTRRHRVGPISFELPVAWRQSSRSEGTVQFDAASGDGYLLADASQVAGPDLTPDSCLAIILKRLAAGPTWRKEKSGPFAIARDSQIERSPNLSNQAGVQRIVGCDGHYSWSLVIYANLAVYTHYLRVGQHVLDTLKPETPKVNERGNLTLEDEARLP